MRLILTPLLFLSSIALSQPEMPQDFFDTPSASEIATEAVSQAKESEKRASAVAQQVREEKERKNEQKRRVLRDEMKARAPLHWGKRLKYIELEVEPDARLNASMAAIYDAELKRIPAEGAPQVTQVYTEALVEQNNIIIYQNERIIELLEGLQTK